MNTRIAIAGISERDIDLLLLEEFQASAPFLEWFVAQALGQNVHLGRCVTVARSVTHSTGESDLELTFSADDGTRTCVMIENKVTAGLQTRQAQRYFDRGTEYVARSRCSTFYTVIVAPSRYFGESEASKGFGSRVTYEQILAWFEDAKDLGERRNYKTALLKAAIEKGTLGYQPEEDAPTTYFWRSYWRLALAHAPELEMAEPKSKPSRAGFIYFRPPVLPRGIDIVHKFRFGYVDLQLRGMGKRLNEVRAVLGPCLETDMTVETAAKSAAIRISVPKLNSSMIMTQQEHAAVVGIEAANRLLAWFRVHQEVWIHYIREAQPLVQASGPVSGGPAACPGR